MPKSLIAGKEEEKRRAYALKHCKIEHVWAKIVQIRSHTYNDKLWQMVPEVYKLSHTNMLGGGVKDSSDNSYTKNFMEFYRTMTLGL